jgi:hypothetical protein
VVEDYGVDKRISLSTRIRAQQAAKEVQSRRLWEQRRMVRYYRTRLVGTAAPDYG